MLSIDDVDKDFEAVTSVRITLGGLPETEWPKALHRQNLIDLGWHEKDSRTERHSPHDGHTR